MFNPLAPKLDIFGRNDTESDSSCDEEDDRDRAGATHTANAVMKISIMRVEYLKVVLKIGGRRQSNFGIYHLDIFLSILCEASSLLLGRKRFISLRFQELQSPFCLQEVECNIEQAWSCGIKRSAAIWSKTPFLSPF